MKKSLNLDLLGFHVREAAQELDLLLDAIQYAKDGTRGEGSVGDEPCICRYRKDRLPLRLNMPTTISTLRGMVGSRRSERPMLDLTGMKSSRARVALSTGSRSFGRSRLQKEIEIVLSPAVFDHNG